MSDKRLSNVDRDEVMWKAKNGLALTLKELAIATGYGYSQWCTWKAQGLPLLAKKITLRKALAWLEGLALETSEDQSQAPHLLHLQAAGESKFHLRA